MSTQKYLRCAGGYSTSDQPNWGIQLHLTNDYAEEFGSDIRPIQLQTSEVLIITPTSDVSTFTDNIIYSPNADSIANKNVFSCYNETYYQIGTDPCIYKGNVTVTNYNYNTNAHYSSAFTLPGDINYPSYYQRKVLAEGIIYDETDSFASTGETITERFSSEDEATINVPGGDSYNGYFTWNVETSETATYTIANLLIPYGASNSAESPGATSMGDKFPFRQTLLDGEGSEEDFKGIKIIARKLTDNTICVDNIKIYQCYYSSGYYEDLLVTLTPNTTSDASCVFNNENSSVWSKLTNSYRMLSVASTDDITSASGESKTYGKCIWLKVKLNLSSTGKTITSGTVSYNCNIEFPRVYKDWQVGYQGSDYVSDECLVDDCYTDRSTVNIISSISITAPVIAPTVTWTYANTNRIFNLPKRTSAGSDSSVYLGEIKVIFPDYYTYNTPACYLSNFYSSSAHVAYAFDSTEQFETKENLSNYWFNHMNLEDYSYILNFPLNHIVNFHADHTQETINAYDLETDAYPECVAYLRLDEGGYGDTSLGIWGYIGPQTACLTTTDDDNLEWYDGIEFSNDEYEEYIRSFKISEDNGLWLTIYNTDMNTWDSVAYNESFNICDNDYLAREGTTGVVRLRMFANNKFETYQASSYSGLTAEEEANKMISQYLENVLIVYPSLKLKLMYEGDSSSLVYYPWSLNLESLNDELTGRLTVDLLRMKSNHTYDSTEATCNLTDWGHEIYLIRDTSTDAYSYGDNNKTLIENRNKIFKDYGVYFRTGTKPSNNLALTEKNCALIGMYNTKEVYNPTVLRSKFDEMYGLYNIKIGDTYSGKSTPETEGACATYNYELEDFCWFDMLERTIKPAGYNINRTDLNASITDKWKPFRYCLKFDETLFKDSATTYGLYLYFDSDCGILKTNAVVGDKLCIVCKQTNTTLTHTITANDLSDTTYIMGSGAILWYSGAEESGHINDPYIPKIGLWDESSPGSRTYDYNFEIYYIPKDIKNHTTDNTDSLGYIIYSCTVNLSETAVPNEYVIEEDLSIPEH